MTRNDLKIPYIAIIALSLLALFPLPYGYYTFLRIAVTLCAGMTSYIYFKSDDKGWLMWACTATAIIFNPIIPIHLTREIWVVLNIVVAGLFGYLLIKPVDKSKKEY